MRLLKIELFKLWHNRISKILIFGYFLLIFSIAILSTIKIEFGPINASIHKINEHVATKDIEKLKEIYKLTLVNLLK